MQRSRTGAGLLATLGLSLFVAACARPVMLSPVVPAVRAATVQTKPVLWAVPADYYKEAEGLSGDGLLRALRKRVDGHTDLGYDGGRDVLFASVDDPTDKDTIVSVYTGEVITGVRDRNTASNKGFNTEHTWPQSLGAEGKAKADLHHLYGVDMKSNGIRSSFPFGLVVNPLTVLPDLSVPGQASKLGTNAGGERVFEPPDRHKGNVARALLYFYTRYAVTQGKGGGPLSMRNWSIEKQVVQQWHKLDPVDDAERLRNERVFAVQKNRNPYIDRPEFVEQVGGAFLTGAR
jgi:endonuclease I